MKRSGWVLLVAALGIAACEGNEAFPSGGGIGGAETHDEMVTERQEERMEAREEIRDEREEVREEIRTQTGEAGDLDDGPEEALEIGEAR